MNTPYTLRHFQLAMTAFFLALFAGTLAFWQILDESLLTAFYRATVTISLTGIDTKPSGVGGEITTILLILSGMAIYGYLASAIVELIAHGVVTGALAERRRRRLLDSLRDHFIICGYGRVGRRVAEEFRKTSQPYVVLDFSEEAVGQAREVGELLVEGTGTRDEDLAEAGLDHARGLVVASDDDADNLYITLSARAARPNLMIVARASGPEAAKKLKLAGADRVVEPYLAAGRVMANLMLKPQVQAFVEVLTEATGDDFRFEEIEVTRACGQSGRTIGELRVHTRTGAYVVALRKRDGAFDTTPGPDATLEEGDIVVAVGTSAEIRALEELFAPREAVAG